MRAYHPILGGGQITRRILAAALSSCLMLLSNGVANAQAMYPEPAGVASTESVGVANYTTESGALGEIATSGGAACGVGSCAAGCGAVCQDPCACLQPRWTVRAGAIYYDRSRPRDKTLVTADWAPDSTPLLNAKDFDLGVAWGGEVSLIRHRFLGTCWDLEGRYFGIDHWSSTTSPVYSATGSVVQFADPFGNTDYPAMVAGSYQSALYNLEFNARRQVGDSLQILAGVRYLNLEENGLSLFRDSGVINYARTQVRADNKLWGFQLGADACLWRLDQFSLEFLGKAGIYGNNADVRMVHAQTSTPIVYTAHGTRSNTAFVGELGLTGVYQLNDRWAFRTGYQVLWIESVALATDQLSQIDPLAGTADVKTDGCPFYHGGFITLECRF